MGQETDSTMRLWMVLEDEESLREIITSVMRTLWDITPLAFATGDQAMAWLDEVAAGKVNGPLPELALLDVRIARGPQGHEVAQRIRSLPSTSDMTIVMITGYTFDEQMRAEIERMAQPDAFLKKPYPELDEFKELLESIIRKRRDEQRKRMSADKPSVVT